MDEETEPKLGSTEDGGWRGKGKNMGKNSIRELLSPVKPQIGHRVGSTQQSTPKQLSKHHQAPDGPEGKRGVTLMQLLGVYVTLDLSRSLKKG